jgi:hypothetical protein
MTSVIANVNRAAAKTTTMGVVTIGRNPIAVVSARRMVASRGLITSNAGKGPATTKDAHCSHLGIINDNNDCCSCRHPPPLCRITIRHCLRPRALLAEVNITATIRDNVPLSKIVVPGANTKDKEEGREWRVEVGGALQL